MTFNVVVPICLDDLCIVHAMAERVINCRNVWAESVRADLECSGRNGIAQAFDKCLRSGCVAPSECEVQNEL